jgi:MurNAc alpha-1-phosphate uridylyltransferase
VKNLNKAMIFAAGRGDRMRPLTDTCPKPLLKVGGKALIEWQIERLADAGFTTIVVNHAWLGAQIEDALGDGSRFGVELRYSAEHEALETAGGIAKALSLLEDSGKPEVFVAVAGDVYADFDYSTLRAAGARLAAADLPGMHLVMVPNPSFHPKGDFVLGSDGLLALEGSPRYTFGSIGLYDTRMFRDLPVGMRHALTPFYRETIAQGRATGALYDGLWENVGTPAQLEALDELLKV